MLSRSIHFNQSAEIDVPILEDHPAASAGPPSSSISFDFLLDMEAEQKKETKERQDHLKTRRKKFMNMPASVIVTATPYEPTDPIADALTQCILPPAEAAELNELIEEDKAEEAVISSQAFVDERDDELHSISHPPPSADIPARPDTDMSGARATAWRSTSTKLTSFPTHNILINTTLTKLLYWGGVQSKFLVNRQNTTDGE